MINTRISGHFGTDVSYMNSRPDAVVAIGSKYIKMDENDEKKFYY